MIEIVPTNKRHVAAIEALAKRKPRYEACHDPMMSYLACTVLNEYSLVALEKGEVLGFLFSFQASAKNYLWLQEFIIDHGQEAQALDIKLIRALEHKLKEGWNSRLKSIKVALRPDMPSKIDFFQRMKYKYTRTDEVLGKLIYQKRVVL